MIRRSGRTIAAGMTLAVTLVVGAFRLGPVPALGPLLNPATGIWTSATHAELPEFLLHKHMPGLDSAVRVFYDMRGVPHIFALSELDAYRALGYVVARDRLFQLDVQTRAANGTLTELVGKVALGADRQTRALGMPRAAERAVAAVDTTSFMWRAIKAYGEGINEYLDHMPVGAMPIEYHLLGAKPARWQPINSFHLINRMSYTLAFNSDELERAAIAAHVGDAAADALVSAHSQLQEPMIPPADGRHEPRWTGQRVPPPGAPDTALASATMPETREYRGDIGSNNWAVAPRRTKAGYALLAGDPHLDLTLPSLWYEAHIVVPGKLDVYGATIPGGPSIVIGFNRDLAWTETNGGTDALDYYAETVDDSTRPTKYRLDGQWRPLEARIEVYRGRNGGTLLTDTVRYTHRGPMRRVGARWLSMRWTALEHTDDIGALLSAAHATSSREWLHDIESFLVPVQNFLVADRTGTIALRVTGREPIRPGDGSGTVIRDGALSSNDWRGDRPLASEPAAIDPAQGFLVSANQEPVDPAVTPGYLGADWPAPWRAIEINALLRRDSAVTPEAMRRYQTDVGSARADYFVPFFLRAAPGSDGAMLLGEWDRQYTRENTGAVLFETAMRELARRVWARASLTANEGVLAALCADSTNAWWDGSRDRVLAASLAAAFDSVTRRYGPPDAGGWRWDKVRTANIYHLLRVPAFSRLGLAVSGGTSTISPLEGRGTHGPSWRMVVELGPTVRAWTIYPGGQSGNPTSSRYADRLSRWLTGGLDSIVVPRTPQDLAQAGTSSVLELDPVERP